MAPPIRVGIIGLGFMGRTHAAAYQSAAAAGCPCRIAAVCDPDASRLNPVSAAGGNLRTAGTAEPLFDVATTLQTTNVDALLASDVELVSICTYTDSHVDLAIRALRAGKHVLIEKPVAVASADVERLADASKSAGTLVMPAMCMRFWPGWDWLRDRVLDGRFGAVRSATFQRLGSGPNWSNDFYGDMNRSGGALVDLHIHDADFVFWCFGSPQAVSSTGGPMHVTTLYHYAAGPGHVVAEGAWDLAPGAGFRMRYVVNFERATAEFDLSGSPAVSLHTAGGSEPVTVAAATGYDGEVRHMLRAVRGDEPLLATVEEALQVARMLEAERRSAETRQVVRL